LVLQKILAWYSNYATKADEEGGSAEIEVEEKAARPSKYKKVYNERDVVRACYKTKVNSRAIKKGGPKGSKAYIKVYARALSWVIEKLSEADYAKVQKTVKHWNTSGPPPEVQIAYVCDIFFGIISFNGGFVSYADRKLASKVNDFLTEIHRSMGVQMVVLAGYRNATGLIKSRSEMFDTLM
jgi:hypothetical protein